MFWIFETILGIIFTLIIDQCIAKIKDSTPYIKRLKAWFINKNYKIQILGYKKYNYLNINTKNIISEMQQKFFKVKIISQKQNSIIVLINNMQAPYEILINTDELEVLLSIQITLIGNVDFKYRENDSNISFLNIMNSLFDLIEMMINEKPTYSFYTLKADMKNNFKEQPFISEHIKVDCEDTNIDIDRTIKYMKINSKTKDNLLKCLKKNIYKIL